MKSIVRYSVAAVALALLALGVIIFSPPRQSKDVQIVTVGDRWLDLLGRDFRVFDLGGNMRGEFWLGKSRVRHLGLEFSPDGQWVWIKELIRQEVDSDWHWRWTLFRATALASPVYVLTDVASLSWSRSGTRLAVTRVGDSADVGSIWIIDVQCLLDGLVCVPPEKLLAENAWEPEWSPDDAQVAYTAKDTGKTLIDVATGKLSRSFGDDLFGCSWIRWSPTGQYLALRCPYRLVIYDLVNEVKIDPGIDGVEEHEWLPDQDTLVYLACYHTDGLCETPFGWNPESKVTMALYTFDMNTRQSRRLTPGNTDYYETFAIWPARER